MKQKLPPSPVSRKKAVEILATLIYPELESKAANKRIQSAIHYAIKTEYLQRPTINGWDARVIFGWVAWMAETAHKRANRMAWANLNSKLQLPKAIPPKIIGCEVVCAPIVINKVPGDAEGKNAELIKAWEEIRNLKRQIKPYKKLGRPLKKKSG